MDTSFVQVGTAEAKQHFSKLANQVFYGRKRVVVTSRGKPKIVIVSVREFEDMEIARLAPDNVQPQKQDEALEMIDRIYADITRATGGGLPDPVGVLRQLRDERDKQIINSVRGR